MAFRDALIRDVALYLLLLPALLVAIAVVRRRAWWLDLRAAALGGAFTIALVKLSGALYYHERPFVVYHIQPLIAHIPDNAFPSDHLAACGLAVTFLWSRDRRLAIVALLCAAAIGYARVAAALHWPVDVAVGFTLGIAGMLLATWVLRAITGSLGNPA
ncbi:MAG: phosphatase PAP2 family protein [Vulcanimicrobiaceae bacterium]